MLWSVPGSTSAHLRESGEPSIFDYAVIGDHVNVLSGRYQHGTEDSSVPFQCQSQTLEEVQIGRNVWIGANSVVMAHVGENCIVGAGAVVIHPVAGGCVVAGVPAHVIRSSKGDCLSNPLNSK